MISLDLFKVLEAGMLFCFGFAWPFNIYKSYKTRTNVGKSLLFLVVIWVGYLFGIIKKALFEPDFILWLYVVNIVMVSIDISLYYRNKTIDARAKASSAI